MYILLKINFYVPYVFIFWAGIAYSVWRPATNWTHLRSNAGRDKLSAPDLTGSVANTIGTGSLLVYRG